MNENIHEEDRNLMKKVDEEICVTISELKFS